MDASRRGLGLGSGLGLGLGVDGSRRGRYPLWLGVRVRARVRSGWKQVQPLSPYPSQPSPSPSPCAVRTSRMCITDPEALMQNETQRRTAAEHQIESSLGQGGAADSALQTIEAELEAVQVSPP